MNYKILFCLMLAIGFQFGASAQCGTTVNTGVCYTSAGGLVQLAVDICPDNPADLVAINFTAGSIEPCCDEVAVYSGAAGTGSTGTQIYYDSQASGDLTGLSIVGTVAGECLHVYIDADGSIDCTTGAGVPASFDITCQDPPLTTGNDCSASSPICAETGSSFVASPGVGDGAVETGVDFGCLSSDEQNPSWWWFQLATTGTLIIDITPIVPTDYDYAVWGPFPTPATCGAAMGAPADCSFVPGTAPEQMNISGNAGEYFVLLINDHSTSGVNYTLELNTSSSGSTNCDVVSCPASAGTAAGVQIGAGTTNSNPYNLCWDDQIELASNNDFSLPDAVDIAGLGMVIYACAPTTTDPNTDPCWTGHYWTESTLSNVNDVNNLYDFVLTNPDAGAGASGVPSNNTLYFSTITMDDIARISNGGADDSLGHDIDGDGCFDLGAEVFEVVYFDEIIATNSSTDCTWNLALAGGLFQHNGTEFTYSITPDATAMGNGASTQTGLTTTGGVVAAPSTLANGTYTVAATDGNSCTVTTGVTLSACATAPALSTTNPCNCANGLDLDTDNQNEYAQEVITIMPGTPAYTVTAVSGLFDNAGNALTTAAATALIAGPDGSGNYTITAYVPADNAATYNLTIQDAAALSANISGGPCAPCPNGCNANNGNVVLIKAN